MERSLDPSLTGKTILIVDDEAGVLEVLAFMLNDLGLRAVTASNGRDGLVKMKQAKPDLLLLDTMMPVMTGPEMLKEIRAGTKYRSLPVVVMSAFPETTVKELFIDSAYDGFLRKPFKRENLMELVQRLLKKNKPPKRRRK